MQLIFHRISWLVLIANLVALLGTGAAIKCQKAEAGDDIHTEKQLADLVENTVCSSDTKCNGKFTEAKGKVKWLVGCGVCSEGKDKTCFECTHAKQCKVIVPTTALSNLISCPQFDGKKSELLALDKLPIIYCTGSNNAEKTCHQFTYKTKAGEDSVWIGCQPDCAAAKNMAGATATSCAEYQFKCPTGASIATYGEVFKLVPTKCTDPATNKCSGTMSAAAAGTKKQKWTLACGSCTIGKGETCFECEESECNIEKKKKIDKDKVIKCPEYQNTAAKLGAATLQTIYCADTGTNLKCLRMDYSSSGAGGTVAKVWMGCKADCPRGALKFSISELTHSCPQAPYVDSEAKLLATEASICITPGTTKCSGTLATAIGMKGKVKWTLACGPCTGDKDTTCFECATSGCNIDAANNIPADKVVKCPSFNGAKASANAGSSKIYCAGKDDARKCNLLEYGDQVWLGCAGDCTDAKTKAGNPANSAECKECKGNCEIKAPPATTVKPDGARPKEEETAVKPGGDSDSGKSSEKDKSTAKGDDANKKTEYSKQSSQLLPGCAMIQALLALSRWAALLL